MKFRIVSDIHFEFINKLEVLKTVVPYMPEDKDTTLLICGDICNQKDLEIVLKHFSKRFKNVVFICGNHDYWKSTIEKTLEFCHSVAKKFPNVYFLENECIQIEDCNIAGCTLWADFKLFGTQKSSGELAEYFINDYRNIRKNNGASRLIYTDTWKRFEESKKFIESLKDKENLIIMTHHACSEKSVRIDYLTNSLSPAYVSNLEELIKEVKPKYWLHGHLHNTSKYQIGDTIVMSNPYGYYDYEENGMYRNFVIDTNKDL